MNIKSITLSLLSLISLSSYGMNSFSQLGQESIHIPEHLGNVEVTYEDKSFYVTDYEKVETIKVKPYDVDKMLRGIDKKKMLNFLKKGYLVIGRSDNGDYTVKANMRLNGGGILGAHYGFIAGKFAVSLVGHTALLGASFIAGPAQPAALLALESTFGPFIEGASLTVGLGCGIAGGAATGAI